MSRDSCRRTRILTYPDLPFRVAQCQRCSPSAQHIRIPSNTIKPWDRCESIGEMHQLFWPPWRDGVWTRAVSHSSESPSDWTFAAIPAPTWINSACVLNGRSVFFFAASFCIQFRNATFFAPLCFGFDWLANLSQLIPSKAFIAVQVVVLATLHWYYVGRSSCLPDVFRHAGLSLA